MPRASKTVLEDFSRFISHQSHFLRQFPDLLHQQAFNESSRPHVRAAAEDFLARGKLSHKPWLRKTSGVVRPRHSGEVISLAFWGDDRHLAVSTDTRELWIWDVDSGDLQLRCDAPPSAARSLSVSPNSKLLAGGFGAPQPNPFISGVWVWERDGKFNREFRPFEWVYSVRWADDHQLIAGAGTPTGADAGGSLWIANLATDECKQVPGFLSERPVALTWNTSTSSLKSEDAMMVLIKDGSLMWVKHDGSKSSSTRIHRPTASVIVDPDTLCLATKDEVLEIKLRERNERLTFSKKTLGRSGLLRESPIRHPTCLASHPTKRLVAIGTATGEAWVLHLDGDGAPKRIHQADAPVTAVAFSASGERIAVGDFLGQVFAYRHSDQVLLFQTPEVRELVAGRVDGERAMMLYPDKLEIAELDDPDERTAIELSESLAPQDFDVLGSLGLVLSCSSTAEAIATGSVIQMIDVSHRRVTQLFDVPSGADALAAAETLIMPCCFEWIRLQTEHNSCRVLLGSRQGIMAYPMFAFGSGEPFVAPSNASDSGLLDPNRPSIWCNGFEVNRYREGEVAARYANKVGSPHAAEGDFRVWRIGHLGPSCSPRLSSPVSSICQSAGGEVLAGTEGGEACSWRFDGEWRRAAGVVHGAPVVAVCCSRDGSLACSASLDGSLVVWDIGNGTVALRTFADLQPIAAGFALGDRSLCVIDRTGEAHVWKIESADAIRGLTDDGDPSSDNESDAAFRFDECLALAESIGKVKSRIDQGDFERAAEALCSLPDSTALAVVKDDWLLRITLAGQRALLAAPVKQELSKLEAISREITEMWLQGRHASDLEHQLRDCLHALTEEFRRFIKEREAGQAKALATALPKSPNNVLSTRRSMLDAIRRVEATGKIEAAAARAKEFIERGDLASARDAVEALADEPPNVLEAKQHLREQLQEIENDSGKIEREIETILEGLAESGLSRENISEMASTAGVDASTPWQFRSFLHALAERLITEQARAAIEALVKSAQELLEEGKAEDARSLVETLPGEPENILEFKRQLLGQIEEFEKSRAEAEQQVATMLRGLAAAGLGEDQINALARENNVDRSNVFQHRALLDAIVEQAPPKVRELLSGEKRGDHQADARRWRFWKR